MRILRRYQAASSRFWQVLLFVLAAALVGGGIILLLAHNWAELPRPVRALLGYVPLALSYAALLLAYHKGQAAREGAGVFHALALIAALALIGQTYHSGGDVRDLLRSSAILLLPVALLYPAQSSACAFVFFATSLLFQKVLMPGDWLLAAASGILLWRQRGVVLTWFVALAAFLLLMRLLFAYFGREAWPAVYVLMPLYYVSGRILYGQDYARNPLAGIGAMGILFLTLIAVWVDAGLFAYLGLGLVLAIVALVMKQRLRREQAAFAALLPMMLFVNYLLPTSEVVFKVLAEKGFLLCSFALGVWLAIAADRQQRWLKLNAAFLLMCNAFLAAVLGGGHGSILRVMVAVIVGLILLFSAFSTKKTA